MSIRGILSATLLMAIGTSVAKADYLSVSATYLKPSKSSYTSKLPEDPSDVYPGISGRTGDKFDPESIGGNLAFESSIGFAIAYGLEFSDGMTLEFEFATRSGKGETISVNNDVDYKNGTVTQDRLAKGSRSTAAKISSNSIMANFVLPLETGGEMIPYFGAGVGFARASINGVSLSFGKLGNDGANTTPFRYSVVKKSSDSSLAYQFMAGVRFPIAEEMQLKLGYRYFAISDLKFNNFPTDFSSHELDLGVLISF